MSFSQRVLRAAALIACALVAGLTLSHVLQSPGSRGLDGGAWLQVQHTFYGGFAVVGGIAEVGGLLAAAAVAGMMRLRGRLAIAHAAAALCLLGALGAYWFGNRPVNALVAGWTPATLPANWGSYRATWEGAHAVTFGLAAIATVALIVVTVWDSQSRTKRPTDRHRGRDADRPARRPQRRSITADHPN